MAYWLLFSICALLMLHNLRERLRSEGRMRAALTVDWLTAAMVVLLPVVTILGLLVAAPGYLQSMAGDNHGRWMIGGAVFAQILLNCGLKKMIDRIVDLKV